MGRITNGKITALLKDYRRAESSAKSDYMELSVLLNQIISIANKKTIQGWINASLAAPASPGNSTKGLMVTSQMVLLVAHFT